MPNWWEFQVIDKMTGQEWSLRVPEASQAKAEAYLWQLGFLTSDAKPWTPTIDPMYREAVEAEHQRCADSGEPWSVYSQAQGEVWAAAMGDPPDLLRMIDAMELEADPIDRHYLLQQLATHHPDPRARTLVCWQWFAEWKSIRARFEKKDESGECLGVPPMVYPPAILKAMLRDAGFSDRSRQVEKWEEQIAGEA